MLRLDSGTFDSRPVALMRVALGIAIVLVGIENAFTFAEIAGGRVAIPLFDGAPPVSPVVGTIIPVLGMLAGGALALGFLSRSAAALAALSSLATLLVEQQTYSGHQVLVLLLCVYLAIGDPGARWSVDARLRGHARDTVARLPVLLVLSQISIVYLFTAIAKINPVYLSGWVIDGASILGLPAPGPMILAWGSIALEFFLAFGLLWRRTTTVAVILGTGFHFMIAATLREPFALWAFSLTMIGTYPLFIYRSRVDAAWGRVIARARSIELTKR